MNISEFLHARIAEDEACANAVSGVTVSHRRRWTEGPGPTSINLLTPEDPTPPFRIARVLADCEAKRAVLKIHARLGDSPDDDRHQLWGTGWQADCCVGCNWGGPCDDYHVDNINECPTLRALASAYSDHPDYHAFWSIA